MPPIRRNAPVAVPTTPSTAPAAPAPSTDAASVEPTRPGWSAPAGRAGAPDGLRDLHLSAEAALVRLAPTALGPIAPAPMLKALGDGHATIDVPLRAGEYKFHGASFTVKPGTVAHVQAQVKDGDLVSVGNGQQGTSVKIDPPLDLPLWVTAQGVELKGEPAHQKFQAELGGFFDVSFKAKRLSDLVSSGDARSAGGVSEAKASAAAGELGPLAMQLVDLSKVKVDAKVTLNQAELDVGGAKVKVDPATTFSVKGDGQHATLSGHVQLDGFGLDQGGVKLSSTGGGQADLTAKLDRTAEGYAVDSKLDHVQLSLDRLESAQPSPLAPGRVDRISLGPTEVHDGSLHLASKVGVDGLRVTGMSAPTVGFAFKASGTINDAQLTVKDAKDTASFAVAGSFKGSVDLGPAGLSLDAQLTGGHVDVRDLQETVKGNSVSIEHATADGDVQVKASSGRVQVDGQVRALDLVVDDFKGGAGAVTADLGRTHASGAAKFHLGSDGVTAEGRLKAEASIDSASFDKGNKSAQLGSSTVTGELTKLDLGKGAPVLRLEKVDASLDVKAASLDLGRANVRGGGQLKGTGTVVLDATGLSLDGKSQVSMALTDGRVHSSTVDLRLGRGSTADVQVNELHLGKTTTVKVGAGTKLNAVLAGGSLTVGGTQVELAKGGHAEFTVKKAELVDGQRDLRGSLKLDASLSANLPALQAAGVKVHPTDVAGRVKVSIDDAHLNDDRLTFSGANVALDARVGHYTGVQNPGQPGVGTLKSPLGLPTVEDISKTSAATLAGVTPPPAGSPVDALRLLRDGNLKLDVPMSGSIKELGIEVVKLPPGSRLELSLAVKDGKLVTDQSKVALVGGVKAIGVEVVGAHLDAQRHVHADLRIAGRMVSVPVPGVKVPGDMAGLADLATKGQSGGANGAAGSSGQGGVAANLLDLSHAQLDVSNATFSKGRISLPGGAVDLAEGSKLSFRGTPLAGELTGAVALDGVTVARDDVALQGGAGRAELKVAWHREGDKAVVEGGLSNLSLTTQGLARKGANGDYVQLGAGRVTGGTLSFSSEVALDAKGLPRRDVKPVLRDAQLNVGAFSGDLVGARQSSAKGTAELGHSKVEGSLSFSTDKGLSLKAKVDEVDAQVSGVQMQRAGRTVDVEQARLQGKGGTIDFSPGRVSVDARQLAWDATVRDVSTTVGPAALKAGQLHISGEGRFDYDSQRDLRVEGRLHVDGRGSGSTTVSHVAVNRGTGVVVR